jgi:hypothetical protein
MGQNGLKLNAANDRAMSVLSLSLRDNGITGICALLTPKKVRRTVHVSTVLLSLAQPLQPCLVRQPRTASLTLLSDQKDHGLSGPHTALYIL